MSNMRRVSLGRSQSKETLQKFQSFHKSQTKQMDADKNYDSTSIEQINQNYQILDKLGEGSYGVVHKVLSRQDQQIYAMKIEQKKVKFGNIGQNIGCHLQQEYEILTQLQKEPFYPTPHELISGLHHDVLIMTCFQESLYQKFKSCKKRFSQPTVANIAVQMIKILENLHSKSYIHRDIKPNNFVFDEQDKLYLIDFGLSVKYRDKLQGHIPFKMGAGFVGTATYASINIHRSLQASRRDDLESVGYILVQLSLGDLPWSNLQHENKHQKQQNIMKVKQQTQISQLCRFCLPGVSKLLEYSRQLGFQEEPNYDYCKSLFESYIQKDTELDWKKKKSLPKSPNRALKEESKQIEIKKESIEVKSFNEQNFDSNFEISEEIHELHLFFQNEATNKKPSVKN